MPMAVEGKASPASMAALITFADTPFTLGFLGKRGSTGELSLEPLGVAGDDFRALGGGGGVAEVDVRLPMSRSYPERITVAFR